jgi:hypothetical protein
LPFAFSSMFAPALDRVYTFSHTVVLCRGAPNREENQTLQQSKSPKQRK